MARIQLLLCFTILLATTTLLDVVSAHELKIKATLPQLEIPKTVKDVEPYTVNVVMVYVTNLEKECPKTSRFKAFFEKVRAYAKYVCPLKRLTQKDDYDKDMKAKAGSLFQTIASFAVGKIRAEIQEEKQEAIETFRKMKALAGRIMGGRKKEETEESMTLTPEQQNEIKEGILKWEVVITKIANTMVQSQSTTTSSSAEKGTSSGAAFQDTTGASSGAGSPSGSPSSSNSGAGAYKDTTGVNPTSPSGSPTTESSISPTASSTSTTTSESASAGASQGSALPVAEVEAETSKEVMVFLMNLEKKCPQKEEYKSLFERLKGTMTATAAAKSKIRKGLFAGLKSGAGKIFDAMGLIRSRIADKSAEVKTSMESYQAEVKKCVEELDAIYAQIQSQNKGKKDEALTCTPEQQKQIKVTITKWEQVTTQFVETSVKTESSSSSTTTSASSSGKM